MADKYIKHDLAGGFAEQEGALTGGAPSANQLVALDANGVLDPSVLPTGVGADTVVIVASEALPAGSWINIFDSAGSSRARLADATTAGREASGFVLAAVASAASATVYLEGNNGGVTGMSPGQKTYLSTTAGVGTNTPPAAAGNIVQRLGRASSATNVSFEGTNYIVLA